MRRGERRVWEVKTGGGEVARDDVNQLLGQIEVETRRAAKTRVYGCLLAPATSSKIDAAEAAGDRIALINHGAAVRLYDILADRIRQSLRCAATGVAEARGDARTKIEALLPPDLLAGEIAFTDAGPRGLGDQIAGLFPPQ